MSTTEQAGPGMGQQSQQWHEIAQQLRVDSIRCHDEGWLRPPNLFDVGAPT